MPVAESPRHTTVTDVKYSLHLSNARRNMPKLVYIPLFQENLDPATHVVRFTQSRYQSYSITGFHVANEYRYSYLLILGDLHSWTMSLTT